MHKQRSKRVGSTLEARKRHYEGKAFSQRNVKKVRKSDWFALCRTSDEKAAMLTEAAEVGYEYKSPFVIDESQHRKPEHAKRAVSIESCFPKIIQSGHEGNTHDNEDLVSKLLNKFGRRK